MVESSTMHQHNTKQESFRPVIDADVFPSEGAIALAAIVWNGSMEAREMKTHRTTTWDGPTHGPSEHN